MGERHPKLFLVSTSSTTSTLSTASLCYVTSATFQGTCSGRKRRAINFDGASVDESEFKPSQLKEDVQSSREDRSLDREGRFLLYWITTTSSPPPPPSQPPSVSTVSPHPDWWQRVRLIYQLDLCFI